jgi:hypothetical protein
MVHIGGVHSLHRLRRVGEAQEEKSDRDRDLEPVLGQSPETSDNVAAVG